MKILLVPFEEDFGAAFATYLRKPTGDLKDEAEVDDDITVSSDEDGMYVTTKGSQRSDPITEWTTQSSEAQQDKAPERFGKWAKTPAGKASQGGDHPRGRRLPRDTSRDRGPRQPCN